VDGQPGYLVGSEKGHPSRFSFPEVREIRGWDAWFKAGHPEGISSGGRSFVPPEAMLPNKRVFPTTSINLFKKRDEGNLRLRSVLTRMGSEDSPGISGLHRASHP
jgi:hypothetical protein